MRLAIIGSGISGLHAARLLDSEHDVSVFEARSRPGGHVNTIDVIDRAGRKLAIDTGFIVYNDHNYPIFSRLLADLGVASRPSDMSFGVRCDRTGVEYSSRTLLSLFAQPRNLVRRDFHAMLRDIVRFNREAEPAVRNGAAAMSVGELVEHGGYGAAFVDHYLEPMGSALWSIPRGQVLEMPAAFFVRFFDNHRMLTVSNQPQWRVVEGGSARYVEALTAGLRNPIRTDRPVRHVARHADGVTVDREPFDHVIFACHADQALRMLDDPTPTERDILERFPFQDNDVVLHTDTSMLPRRRTAWASWNYRVRGEVDSPATVTYNMNRLQTLEARETYCVTLNDTDAIDPDTIIYRSRFSHPHFTRAGIDAQSRKAEISGVNRTHYCGAYWGFGFHEDGARSAVDVARHFGVEP